ncbi:hypothetical protein EJ05DRAFT_506376 [Pseudovirgaria hyperparasitica]|uniref:Ribosome biogenesis protein Alb1 n=1 Tax=Pseudovirgaria hyperparasitica TaxID=470096 RepID=A0A6A6WKK3_9PEZI|nr:uncharacterized protein EJ05DRAFT_506376 [Pseudovirgaria hyperparasitica]KAF2762681.1 hypothetical protein EJ05DRAFT_506376 [Pseudovirgaria hyperparasitica]
MGKTPKPKSKKVSLHSRAARRETSPTLAGNIDKSLLNVPRASSPRDRAPRHSVLAANTSAGVSKRPKRGQHTRHQKLRREKISQKADEFAGKLETKTTLSVKRAKKIKERAKAWEDVNDIATIAPVNKFDALRDEGNNGEDWEDMDDDETMREASNVKTADSTAKRQPLPSSITPSVSIAPTEEDEIL